MFEPSALRQLSDEALISAATAAARAEAAATAQRLAYVAEITARQCEDEDDGIAHQAIDGWAYAQAQVGAACNISARAASKQMRIAIALRDRLPRTAAVFTDGAISTAVVETITWRTRLVEDADALMLIDAAVAAEAATYGVRSEKSLIGAVDFWVQKFDPCAIVRSKRAAKDLYVEFGDRDDENGVASFWGRLRATDSEALKQRLHALADTVCPDDPRSRGELIAAAMGSLGVVGPSLQRLTCLCGHPDCEGGGKDPRSVAVTIYALTDQVAERSGAQRRREVRAGASSVPGTEPDAEAAADPDSVPAACPAPPSPAVMLTGGIIPAEMLAELAATGATVKKLADVADLPEEPRYTASARLTAFVRMRHLTCTFPGCGRPAHACDLDHLHPWPAGATHPGNLGPLCRLHHLLKTFCGWAPKAAPDGTITWTAPTGHTYVTRPGASMLFPHWNIESAIPPLRPVVANPGRQSKMPRRPRTRAQDRAQRIKAERALNINDPPPF